jgi:hypothetical protein
MWHFILGKGRTTFIAGVLLSGALLWVLRGGATQSQIASGALPGVTVSRASNKTCATGAAQDPAQLLVDPEFSVSANWGPSGATFTAKAAAGPDGLVNAASLVTVASGSVISQFPVSTPSAVPYTATVYARLAAGSGSGFQLVIHDTGGSNPCSLSTTVTSSYQRFTCTGTATAAGALQVYVQAPANSTIYIADAKLELGSSATAYNFTGFDNRAVVTLGSNTPCVEPNGLSVEGSATNLALQSQAMTTAPWTAATNVSGPTATANTTDLLAPDGTQTATRIDYPAVGTPNLYSTWRQSITTTAAAHAFSMYLRTLSGTATVYLDKEDVVTDLNQACTVTTTWSRCTLTGRTSSASGWTPSTRSPPSPRRPSTPGARRWKPAP